MTLLEIAERLQGIIDRREQLAFCTECDSEVRVYDDATRADLERLQLDCEIATRREVEALAVSRRAPGESED